MRKSGMSEWNVSTLIELYQVLRLGSRRPDDAGRSSTLLGRPPIRFEQFARDHASAFHLTGLGG